MASYKASARSLDHGVGAVLQALDQHRLVDDTLVIFTTDHGLAFPGAKATLYDRGIGVTLIMRGPGGFDGGRVIDALVSHLDIYPTLCDLAGVERPAFLQGESLLPLASRHVDEVRDAIVRGSARSTPPTSRSARCARSATSTSGASATATLPVLANTDDGPEQGPAARARLGRAADPVRAALRPVARPQRGEQPARRPCLRRRAPGPRARGSSAGCARPTTRCSTGRWRPRRAPRSTRRTSGRPAEPTLIV